MDWKQPKGPDDYSVHHCKLFMATPYFQVFSQPFVFSEAGL